MAKKNIKSTGDTLNVVSSEPVNSIEEVADKLKDSKGVETEVKDEADKTEIGGAKTNATETSENEEKSKESTEVTDKKEESAEVSDKKSEINATDSSAAISVDKKEVADKKDDTDKNDDVSTKDDKKQGSQTAKGNYVEEDAPAPPPRPISPLTQIKQDLKDAFPNIEEKIITAVLIASQGNPDPAFNALLYISDPSVEAEIPEPAPPVPSKPVHTQKNTLTDDELLARKLQKEFELEDKRRRAQHHDRDRERRRRRQQSQPEDADDDSVDEFGQIKESFSQGFEEARTTLNGWVSGLAKKFQEPTDDAIQSKESQSQNPKLFGALGGSSFTKQSKKNTFDEDPRIISNDLHSQINLKDNDEDEQDAPSLPKRQGDLANREKSTQSDSYIDSNKKWQPLNSDVPVNSDAFLVTDSEDEDTGVTSYDTKKTKQSS
ncbi:uncharacterized protein AC631_03794 [Debaryomyces fabryi]|uniref:CUE domain-containing protein n=1 Tax=Debaryomyces fabryi TaxID=58627 RepID=A0A0V1PWA1_9ASCO|nr:uncharacterized protein AC631_03794 [Debaryomyces fabryi]KSA00467.1 hypothetical protein AC631_03794 [Debaryomyces fabryi]CUM46523.1 unnamed protein product [Debaryomyces fabryi]